MVIPTRNRRELLAVTLSSVLVQQGVDLEVVVVDDGSTDDTAEWLATQPEARLRVLCNATPRGVAEARNVGARHAEGAWVAFCDDDDVWSPSKLKRQLDCAAAAGRSWALGGAINFETRTMLLLSAPPPSSDEVMRRLPWHNGIPGGCSNVVVRAEMLAETGGFHPALRTLADWDLWIRVARIGPPAVIDEPVVGYRMHAGMSADPRGLVAELALVEARSSDLRGGAAIDAGWVHRWSGQNALRAGHRWQAIRAFARAVAHGDTSSAARVGLALLGPRAAVASMRLRHPVSPEYQRAADEWLLGLIAGERHVREEAA